MQVKLLIFIIGKQLSEKSSIEIELEEKKLELQRTRNQLRLLESAKEDYLEFQQQAKVILLITAIIHLSNSLFFAVSGS